MSFDRTRLPEPIGFYEAEGLKLVGKGKWRTTRCMFHDGSDSMRINTTSGAFVCMNCAAKGGDVLAYQMAAHGVDFVTAAKALGAWIDDGKPAPTRPTPIPARDGLEILKREANLIAVAGANVANGVQLKKADLDRVLKAAGRINTLVEVFA